MNLRNQKGINMITLSVAVLILIVITSILVYSSRDGIRIRNLKDLYNDIESLNDKISSYYVQHGDIPKLAKYENLAFLNVADYNQLNPNNGEDFYVIDLKALEGVTLNYGIDYDRVTKDSVITEGFEDLYIINKESHTIYYPKGIEVQGVKYFTYAEEWSKIGEIEIPKGISISPDGYTVLKPTTGTAKISTEVKVLADLSEIENPRIEYTIKKNGTNIKTENRLFR